MKAIKRTRICNRKWFVAFETKVFTSDLGYSQYHDRA